MRPRILLQCRSDRRRLSLALRSLEVMAIFGTLIAVSRHLFSSVIAGVMVLSEVGCLMMMFGSGASTAWNEAQRNGPQPKQ